jgi:penicillin amidase
MMYALLLIVSFSLQAFTCKPTFDETGIPHLSTSSREEFYFCFGYLHGSDRGWEMDYFRRLALGRNAEVLGYSQLKSDLMMRFLNLEEKMTSLWKDFPEDYKKLLQHYADGVNQGFKTGKKAREFVDSGFEPEPWKPEHSILVLLIQSFDQTRKTFYRDYEEAKNKETWGSKAESLFDIDGMPWANTILKDGEYEKKKSKATTTSIEEKIPKLWSNFPALFGLETGSNNWVVSSKKSKTGHALLANDPHLDLRTPMFWYWLHLKSPDGEIIGASVPGVPAVPSGTNGKVAWGLTNAYLNTADAIFVKDARPEDFISVRPTVKVKFGPITLPFFFKSFEQTRDGLRVLPLEIESENKMLLRWTGFHLKPQDFIPMFEMMNVQNVDDMDALLSKVGVPAWNFVFADTKGDIGFRVVGHAYRQTEKNPYGIPTRTLKEIREEVYLTPAEMPHLLRPKRNYIYTANNRHWPADSAFYGGRAYSDSFRGFRIDEMLKASSHDIDSFKVIQCDRQVVDARFFTEMILKHMNAPELNGWNFSSDDHSNTLPVYRRFMDIMMQSWKVNEFALYRLLLNPSENQRNEMQSFYKKALKDVNGRNWGELHRLSFPHLSKKTEWVFSPEIAGPGDNHSVDPGTAQWNSTRKLYEQSNGASMKMVIELSSRPRIDLALPGLNRLYTEKTQEHPWQNWRNCTYKPISY